MRKIITIRLQPETKKELLTTFKEEYETFVAQIREQVMERGIFGPTSKIFLRFVAAAVPEGLKEEKQREPVEFEQEEIQLE